MATGKTSVQPKCQLDRDMIMKDLDEKGYCVIPNVLASEDCDVCMESYRDWLAKFPERDWPLNEESLIMTYRIGHFKPTWQVRLGVRKVFETVWQTKKLLASFDSVAISPPPELYETSSRPTSTFATPGYSWLHVDQSAPRQGLHCYQGAVYLEEASDTDYCFRILAGSHRHILEFYQTFPEAAAVSVQMEDFCLLEKAHGEWYRQRGCHLTKVPVPKGGMVLWDSRLVHDNCRPERGRLNSDRWRFVVFVCMAPARWSCPENLAKKRHAYQHLRMTTHWPAQGVAYFEEKAEAASESPVPVLDQLPDVARSQEARMLAGVEEYDFEDGEPNGPAWDPVWLQE